MNTRRVIKLAKIIKALDVLVAEYESAYADDSDSENNAHTNGYFTPRSSEEEDDLYFKRKEYSEDYKNRLVQEALK